MRNNNYSVHAMGQAENSRLINLWPKLMDLSFMVRGIFLLAVLGCAYYGQAKYSAMETGLEVSNDHYQQLLKQQKRYRNNLAFNQLLNEALADGVVTEYEFKHIQNVAPKVVLTENVSRSLQRAEAGEVDSGGMESVEWLGQQSEEALPAWLVEYQDALR